MCVCVRCRKLTDGSSFFSIPGDAMPRRDVSLCDRTGFIGYEVLCAMLQFTPDLVARLVERC
jgi:hypothetical protein